MIDYKAGASLFSGTNYSLYSEGLHKGTLLGRTVDNPGGSGFIGAGVMIDDNGKILGENNVAVNAQDYHKGIVNNNIAEEFVYNASFIKLRELSLGYTAYNNTNGQGLELNGYPATRNVGFNVNVKF